jgi:LmbE family N-acetylglucosaminyl deacetylase
MARNRKSHGPILVLCAHSDDQILGVGGTMAKYAKEGKDIHTVIFSFGEQSHPWIRGEITADARIKESEEANKIVGGKSIKFLGLREGKFPEEFKDKNMFGMLHQLLIEYEPERIFTHSIDDPHPDHKAVHRIVLEVVESLGYKCDVYTFDVWNLFRLKKSQSPRLYVDITGTFGIKIKAINEFASQWLAMLLPRMGMYMRAFIDGTHNDCRYAESFLKVR